MASIIIGFRTLSYFLHFFMFSHLLYFFLIRSGEKGRNVGKKEGARKGRKGMIPRKNERGGSHQDILVEYRSHHFFLLPPPSPRPPLFVSSSLSSLSSGRRRLIFGIPPTRRPPALLGMENDRRYVSALHLTNRLTPIKTSVKRHIRTPAKIS